MQWEISNYFFRRENACHHVVYFNNARNNREFNTRSANNVNILFLRDSEELLVEICRKLDVRLKKIIKSLWKKCFVLESVLTGC